MRARFQCRGPFVGLVFCLLASAHAHGQTTANGNLVVSMTVEPTLSVTFVSGTGGNGSGSCGLTGGGTSSAVLNFGTASIAGKDDQSCVQFTANGTTSYTLEDSVSVLVSQSNSTSTSYTLKASLGSSAPTGVTWSLGYGQLTLTTSPQVVTTTGTYGSTATEALEVNVTSTVASGSLANSVIFQAISN